MAKRFPMMAAVCLAGVFCVEKSTAVEPASDEADRIPLSALELDKPETRQRLPTGFSGRWKGEIMGAGFELRLEEHGKGFTGTLKLVHTDDRDYELVPLIQRRVVDGKVTFVAPLGTDAGNIAFELGMDGKKLKGHLRAPDLSDGKEAVVFEKSAAGKDAKKGGVKLAGTWEGSYEGVAVRLELKDSKNGIEGMISMSVLGSKLEMPIEKTSRKGDRIPIDVKEGGDVVWSYQLVVEGDILTGYRQDEDDPEKRVWVAFEKREPSKKASP